MPSLDIAKFTHMSMDLHHTHVQAIAQYVVDTIGGTRKIDCIKKFRQLTGCGLLESKKAIEFITEPPKQTILEVMTITPPPVDNDGRYWPTEDNREHPLLGDVS